MLTLWVTPYRGRVTMKLQGALILSSKSGKDSAGVRMHIIGVSAFSHLSPTLHKVPLDYRTYATLEISSQGKELLTHLTRIDGHPLNTCYTDRACLPVRDVTLIRTDDTHSIGPVMPGVITALVIGPEFRWFFSIILKKFCG